MNEKSTSSLCSLAHQPSRTAFALIVITLFLLSTIPHSFALSDDDTKLHKPVIWDSGIGPESQLALAKIDLVVSLYNANRLPIAEVILDEGQSVAEILQSQNLDLSRDQSLRLSSLICDLNDGACQRVRDPVSIDIVLAAPLEHIGGYYPSKAFWKSKTPHTLYLPRIELVRFYSSATKWKDAGVSRDEFVSSLDLKCSPEDVGCATWLTESIDENKVLEASRNFKIHEGLVDFEFTRYRAVIDTSCDSDCSDSIMAFERPSYFDAEFMNWYQLNRASPGAALAPISQHLLPQITNFEIFSAPTDPLFEGHQAQLFNDINHPYLSSDYFEEGVSEILVIDSGVYYQHCDFDMGVVRAIDPENKDKLHVSVAPLPANDEQDPCTELRGREGNSLISGNETNDHGTHVTGLIVASTDNGKGVAGLASKNARVTSLQLNLDKINSDATYVVDLLKALEDVLKGNGRYDETIVPRPAIVNISAGYYPAKPLNLEEHRAKIIEKLADWNSQLEPLEDLIQRKEDEVLFVVAAGNDNRLMDGFCNLLPACLDYDNVISVAGLEFEDASTSPVRRGPGRSPVLWNNKSNTSKGSNFGNQFHVGAIANPVASTGSDHSFVRMQGTSQAAPQVSSVAALYLGGKPKMRPVEVKNRIMACADHYGELNGKVRSGLLNAYCVIRDDVSLVVSDDDELEGKLHQVTIPFRGDRRPVDEILFRKNGVTYSTPIRSIRAMHKIDNMFTIYVSQNAFDAAEKISGLTIADDFLDAEVEIKVSNAAGTETSTEKVDLFSIVKFVQSSN